jgi:stage III sporulation protein AH
VLFNGKDNTVDPNVPSDGTVNEGEGNGDTTVVEGDGYFSATQVSRQRARDEALEVLQSVVDSESADEATKTEALLEIADLARAMEAEANIETMVMAKGFERCVAVINGDTCSVVVNGTELQENQISQINEIVYEQTGIKPTNIRIVTK